ncbi:MAG: MoaD/ThiS family protein [Balneolaceae bacterium]|nr:MoaD/ThiS family protein [Balneolaceae bacterium]
MKKHGLEEHTSIQLAVNQELNAKKTLENGDEVAFLPPYAGG